MITKDPESSRASETAADRLPARGLLSSMSMILYYEYVPDVLDRRTPHRPAHLALLRDMQTTGECLLAGATSDPVNGAAFVFSSAEAAERFVQDDPYGSAGLVTAHRVEPIALVVP